MIKDTGFKVSNLIKFQFGSSKRLLKVDRVLLSKV